MKTLKHFMSTELARTIVVQVKSVLTTIIALIVEVRADC